MLDPEGGGRWFTIAQRDASGQEWIIAAPATFDTIVSKLYEMRNRLSATT